MFAFVLLTFVSNSQTDNNYSQAESLYIKGNTDTSLILIQMFITDSAITKDKVSIADAYNLAGNIYEDQGNFANAYENYYKAMQLYYALGEQKGLAHAVNNVANMYYRKGMFEEALKFQTFALKVRTELKDTTGIASSYNNIGNIFFSWKHYEKALKFYNRAIKLKSESGDTLEIINIRMNIGSAWLGLKNYEIARFHYHEALRLADAGKNFVLKADGLINLGYNEFLSGNFDKALTMFDEALAISNSQNLEFERMLVMKNKGELFLTSGNFEKAEKYLDSAEAICNKVGIRESMLEILQFRIDIFVKQNKYKEAWEIHNDYEKLNDELFSENTLQKLYDFQKIQEFESKQREIRIKDLELELKNNQLNSLQIILIISVLSFILISVTIFMLLRINFKKKEIEAKQKQYSAIQKALSAQMNPHFISNSLSSIQNFFLNNDIPAASDYLNRFGKLIRKVLDLSMKEFISVEEELELIRLYVQLEELRLGKPIILTINMPDDFPAGSVAIPPLLLQPVIENSIWHGISQHEKDGKINIAIDTEDEFLVCSISDNGAGLNAVQINPKPRKEKSYGLNLTKERLNLMSPRNVKIKNCEITEIKDEKENVGGVNVKLKIPLNYV